MRKFSKQDIKPQTIAHRGRFDLSAVITPGAGSNLISFKVDGKDLIYWDEAGFLADASESFTGAFNMYPTPCRLDNCTYSFEKRTIVQKKKGEKVFIHGLVRDEPFQFKNTGASLASWIDVTPSHPVYEGFPWTHKFMVVHTLTEAGLEIRFKVENHDKTALPFGFGVHPFWRIPGKRADVSIRIPCDNILELKDLVPTGNYSPVTGTDMDLRTLRSIDTLYVDNVFWPRKSGDAAEIIFKSIDKAMTIEASGNFPHMIVYAPKGKDFLCVENLTSTPNAPNLVEKGKGNVASMLTAAPGAAVEGWIRYTIRKL